MSEDFLQNQLDQASDEEKATFEAEKSVSAVSIVSHAPRERVYDDTEQRIVSGRLWLISFTDLFSIMLCFFLMIYSMRDPDIAKITTAIGVHGGGTLQAGDAQNTNTGGTYFKPTVPHMDYGEGINLDYLEGVLRNVVVQAGLKDEVRLVPAGNRLKLVIDGDHAFSDGHILNQNGMRIIKALAPRLMLLSNRVTVVNIPEHAGDWAQSLEGASNAGSLMRESGYRKSFTVLGAGAGQGPALEIHIEADDGRLR